MLESRLAWGAPLLRGRCTSRILPDWFLCLEACGCGFVSSFWLDFLDGSAVIASVVELWASAAVDGLWVSIVFGGLQVASLPISSTLELASGLFGLFGSVGDDVGCCIVLSSPKDFTSSSGVAISSAAAGDTLFGADCGRFGCFVFTGNEAACFSFSCLRFFSLSFSFSCKTAL